MAVDWLTSAPILATIIVCVAMIPLDQFRYSQDFVREFVGTIVMIAATFSAGKWWGLATPVWLATSGIKVDWLWHWAGVVIADWSCGGPQVNPSVAWSMLALGKINYSQFVVHVSAQLLGGIVAFPLLQNFAKMMGWNPLGGPAVTPSIAGDALNLAIFHEVAAIFLLLLCIFVVSWEPPISFQNSKTYYLVKISLIAFTVRALIENFGAAGPSINPMLATAWYVYESGTYPTFAAHYLIYWVASIFGALAASLFYALIKQDATFFGALGPTKIKTN